MFTDTGLAQVANPLLFRCQPSTSQGSGQFFTPNIPDLYFDHENAAAFSTGDEANLTLSMSFITYIYTVPPQHNCDGSVIAIEYCYIAKERHLGRERDVFDLFFLSMDEDHFIIDWSVPILSIPTSSKCQRASPSATSLTCCDTTSLSSDKAFQLPLMSFTFGITVALMDVLFFADSATDYNVQHAEGQFIRPTVNNTFTPSGRITSASLPLIRLHTGILVIPEHINRPLKDNTYIGLPSVPVASCLMMEYRATWH